MDVLPFVVDANSITNYQRCKRYYLLNEEWRPLRWVPKVLFDACLRQGIVELSNGKPVRDVSMDATTRFMNTAANPGLELAAGDPFTISQDYCAMLETILQALSRRPLTKLEDLPSVFVHKQIEWVFMSHVGDDGMLHRWITCDALDDDRIAKEAHSWRCFGDIAASQKPMMLHVVEIGQIRNGRRHSPWARAYKHQWVKGHIKFARKGDKPLQGEAWKPIYLADADSYDSRAWVDVMENDGIIDGLIKEVEFIVPSIEYINDFHRQIRIEVQQMREWKLCNAEPRGIPMARGSCDDPYPCSFQSICYAPDIDVNIESLRLYKPRAPRA